MVNMSNMMNDEVLEKIEQYKFDISDKEFYENKLLEYEKKERMIYILETYLEEVKNYKKIQIDIDKE